jgi:hypothetical protein
MARDGKSCRRPDAQFRKNRSFLARQGRVESFACACVIAAFKSKLSTVVAKLERGEL